MPFRVEPKYIIQTEEVVGVLFPVRFIAKMMQENRGETINQRG